MEARRVMAATLAAAIVLISSGAGYRTVNFVIDAPTPDLAEKIGRAAEQYRRDLAIEWLGAAMPNWSQPCPIHAQVESSLGAGGATSFMFDRGEVFGWHMDIQGSEQRVLDSVLPHEVTHTIFASHFRRPLPRWADEGACTTVEDVSERSKQDKMLINFLHTGRGIAFSQMFAMTDYPPDILPLYAQGYSLARYLIDQHGKHEFLTFLKEGMESERWPETVERHYGYKNLAVLQETWLDWVKQGSPRRTPGAATAGGLVAKNAPSRGGAIVRAQSADRDRDATHNPPLVPVPVAVGSAGKADNSGNVALAAANVVPPAAPLNASPQMWPVRNGSVAMADASPSAPRADAVGAAAAAGPAPVPGKSVYGDGVGLIHHSAEAQPPATSGAATDSADSASAPPAAASTSSTAVPHVAGRPRDVLLEWSR